MRDPEPESDGGGVEPDRGSIVRTPLWVKLFGIVALVVVLVFVVLLLTGQGHGPGRHAGFASGHTSTSDHPRSPWS